MCGYKSSERHKVREQKKKRKEYKKMNIVLLLTIHSGLDDERK